MQTELNSPRTIEPIDRTPSSNSCWQSATSLTMISAVVLVSGLIWSYWTVFCELFTTWGREADYSHGYLVIPISLFLLWLRREQCPVKATTLSWGGFALVIFGITVRAIGRLFYIDAVAGWSLPIVLAGMCWLFFGKALARWASPSLLFLFFMVPLPFRAEHLLSIPLQWIATRISCFLLVCLGQPALREGNVIIIDQFHFEVAEACSGLRMFVSIIAVAFLYVMLVRRHWSIKATILLCVIPTAILANSIRIVLTGLLYTHLSSEAAQRFSHDLAGWMMMPIATAMLALILLYLDHLFVDLEPVARHDLLRRVEGRHR